MDILVMVFEKLDALHIFDRLVLSHIVGIEPAAPVVHRNEVLLEGLQADQLITHQMTEYNLYLFSYHPWLIPVQINL